MTNLIMELKQVMKEKHLSAEHVSRFLDCSAITVFRWLRGQNPPSLTSQRLIRKGIDEIRETYPDKKKKRVYLGFVQSFCPDLKLSEAQANFYEDILSRITFKEISRRFLYKDIKPAKVNREILKIADMLGISQSE